MGLVVSGELLLEVVTEVGGELDSVTVVVDVVVLVGDRSFCCRRFCRYSRLIICRLVSWEAAGLVVSVGSWLGVVTVVETSQDPKQPADDPILQTLFFVCTDNMDRLWKKVCRMIVCRV